MGVLDNRFEKNFMISSVDYVFNWARKSAIWPLTFGLACCAIEMIAATTARFDMARFGAEVFRPSPRQADLTHDRRGHRHAQNVARSQASLGTDAGPQVVHFHGRVFERRWPVQRLFRLAGRRSHRSGGNVYVIGCPPRPEALFYALLKLSRTKSTRCRWPSGLPRSACIPKWSISSSAA